MIMRFTYSVLGTVKFLSHLDLLKLFAKSVARAGIPIAFSEGFNPHAKITFGPPKGVAVAGSNEYCDMKLTREMSTTDFIEKLNEALPQGIRVTGAKLLLDKAPSLMAQINYAKYEIEVYAMDMPELARRIDEMREAKEILFKRYNPKKPTKTVDLKKGIKEIRLDYSDNTKGKIYLDLVSDLNGGIKPSEILTVLEIQPEQALVTRTGMYIYDGDKISLP